MSAEIDRARLPDVGPARSFVFPSIEKSILPSGMRVWTVPHRSIQVVSVILLIRRGSADDPPEKPGLAALTADMLDEGSGDRSAISMHEALARIGAQFNIDIGNDAIAVSVTMLSRFLERGLALVGDMVVRPALSEADFLRVRQLRLHRLTQLRDVPAAVAERTFASLLYGSHPYGHLPIGTEESLGAMSVDEVRAFHAALVGGGATLIVAGDCDHYAVERTAAEVFRGWGGGGGDPLLPATLLPSPPPLHIVQRTGAPQSEIRIGHVAAARSTPDYHALVAMNMVLGGQFVSRINLNLRQDKGLTYGARTMFDFRRMPGPFVLQASVETAGTAMAIRESIDEIAAIRGDRPIAASELALGVAALTRGYSRGFETADQISRAVLQLALYDLPDDYFAQFVPRMEQIAPADAMLAASRHLYPDRLVTLVVGDADLVGRELEQAGLGTPEVLAAT